MNKEYNLITDSIKIIVKNTNLATSSSMFSTNDS